MARSPPRSRDRDRGGRSHRPDSRDHARDRHRVRDDRYRDERPRDDRPREDRPRDDRRRDERPRDDRANHHRDRERSRERHDERNRGGRDWRGPPRREPSRDRDRYRPQSGEGKRSREISPSDYRSNKKQRGDGSTSSPRSFHGDNRDRRSGRLTPERPRTPVLTPEEAAKKAEEEKIKVRQARLAEYLAKKAKEDEEKRKLNGETAKEESASTDATSQAAPTPAPAVGMVNGKFDPKAISMRAQAKLNAQKATLGGDIVIPKSTNQAIQVPDGRLTDKHKAVPSYRRDAKVSGFGLNKSVEQRGKQPSVGKGATSMQDEEVSGRKLERLSDMPSKQFGTSSANVPTGQDEGDALLSDEEERDRARAAAARRAEELKGKAIDEETPMTDVQQNGTTEDVAMDDDDEVDPLDAFMNDLVATAAPAPTGNSLQLFDVDDPNDILAPKTGETDEFLAKAAKISGYKKKDMPVVDHAKFNYEEIRKEFYSESVELAEMTSEEVDELRVELDNIKCRGADPPKPIVKWSQGGFGAQILEVIQAQKFEKPTAIQSQALPAIMSGRDVIGVAKTGSGKTLAFILPMFRHIMDQRRVANLEGPIAIILAPTRELVTQIHRECKPYLKALNLRAACCYGGNVLKDEIADLKRGAEVVVATAGRLIDLLTHNAGRVTNLHRVSYVVLDEADRMFDLGFEPQIMKILSGIRPDRQTVLFSATFPRQMEALARKSLTKPLEIVVGGRSIVAAEITQVIQVVSDGSRFKRLLELLGTLHDRDEDARSLIFVDRQEIADTMYKELTRKGYPCVSVHGGREQIDRDQSVSDFKAGIYPVMVATSVAARGLDVKQLKLVVNFDCPNHHEDYVHRVGRTGRAGNTGLAVTFVTPEQDRFAKFLIKALQESKNEVPEELLKLKEAHDEKVKAGLAKKAGAGFGGRGIERYDEERDAARNMERKQFKTDDDPDDEEEEDKDKKDGKKDKAKSKLEELLAKSTGAVTARETHTERSSSDAPVLSNAMNDAISNALTVHKATTPAPGTSSTPSNVVAAIAAAAANVGQKRGKASVARAGAAPDNRGPDAGEFHAILEINEFPQPARWSATNRTNVKLILDATGTSITSKGRFYPPGQEPGPGEEPKLYVLVEGDTEMQVKSAMEMMTERLKEGALTHLANLNRAAPSGRYNVL